MKYIDADKLIAEVERRKEKWLAESRLIRKGKDKAMYAAGKSSGYTEFLSLIDSLQQEQPEVDFVIKNYKPSLPEAAEEYADKHGFRVPYDGSNNFYDDVDVKASKDGFKAGAEWMAGQGVSFNTKVGWIDGPTILDWPDDILDKFEMGNEVIVQIRKK